MGVYAVTGSASGIGGAVTERLRSAGHEVIGVDLRDAEVVADLSEPSGRRAATEGVLARAGGRIDGAVLAAGVGGSHLVDNSELVARVNVLGTVELLEAWRPALAAAERAKVVVIASNAASTAPVPEEVVDALLAGEIDDAIAGTRYAGPHAPSLVYAATKVALARWVRRNSVTAEWAGAGIRLNALAPGITLTPLVERQFAERGESPRPGSPLPIGEMGDAGHMADWAVFMLSPAAGYLCGSVIYVDGGTDAWLRAEDWPRPFPIDRIDEFSRRSREFRPYR